MNDENNSQKPTLRMYFKAYLEDKRFEKILAQKSMNREEIERNTRKLERYSLEKAAEMMPVLQKTSTGINKGREWENEIEYVMGLAIPEQEYYNKIKNNIRVEENWSNDYKLGIARINRHGLTERMMSDEEKYCGKSFEDITFAYFTLQEENGERKEKKSKQPYLLYQGSSYEEQTLFGIANNTKDAHIKLFERAKHFANLARGTSHIDIVITHPYKTKTSVTRLDV